MICIFQYQPYNKLDEKNRRFSNQVLTISAQKIELMVILRDIFHITEDLIRLNFTDFGHQQLSNNNIVRT